MGWTGLDVGWTAGWTLSWENVIWAGRGLDDLILKSTVGLDGGGFFRTPRSSPDQPEGRRPEPEN